MNDALDSRKAWRRPWKRYLGRRLDGVSHVVATDGRNVARRNKVDFHRLRFDDHSFDMAFYQLGVGLMRLPRSSKMRLFAQRTHACIAASHRRPRSRSLTNPRMARSGRYFWG